MRLSRSSRLAEGTAERLPGRPLRPVCLRQALVALEVVKAGPGARVEDAADVRWAEGTQPLQGTLQGPDLIRFPVAHRARGRAVQGRQAPVDEADGWLLADGMAVDERHFPRDGAGRWRVEAEAHIRGRVRRCLAEERPDMCGQKISALDGPAALGPPQLPYQAEVGGRVRPGEIARVDLRRDLVTAGW